jgi:hypothetical protein
VLHNWYTNIFIHTKHCSVNILAGWVEEQFLFDKSQADKDRGISATIIRRELKPLDVRTTLEPD